MIKLNKYKKRPPNANEFKFKKSEIHRNKYNNAIVPQNACFNEKSKVWEVMWQVALRCYFKELTDSLPYYPGEDKKHKQDQHHAVCTYKLMLLSNHAIIV